ncbi:MAG: signal peptide peptidase SppA [Candidatus Rokubacteria bacterium]|nr:signal peptide peptidase SppA [Candidatus Rokubacteria bacterium]
MRITFALVLLLLTAGCGSVVSIDLSPRVRPLQEETVEGSGDDKILLMDISGFLSDESTSNLLSLGTPPARVPLLVRIREELKKATDDPKVKAVLLKINTPGGTVTASDVIYRELELFKREKKVPVVAVMMDVAASGGYYVALAADTIVAHPTSVTGSIGVVMLTFNAEGLMQKLGVSASAIKSAERKDMGSPFRPLTADERAIFQSVIDDLYAQFLAKVVARRSLPEAAARGLADGRVYSAAQALQGKLIDHVGYMPDALELTKKAAGLDKARLVVYHRPRQYRTTYYAESHAGEGAGGILSQAALGALLGPGPKMLYLWMP